MKRNTLALQIDPSIDLVSIMLSGMGESFDEEVFFLDEADEAYRLNGGTFGQVGKGFHAEPFVPIENVSEKCRLDAEESDDALARLFGESYSDPDPQLVEVVRIWSLRYLQNKTGVADFFGQARLFEGKLVECVEQVTFVTTLEQAKFAATCGLLPIYISNGVAICDPLDML